MTQVDAQYRQQARSAAINICSQVLPMDKLPTALKEAYDNLFEELLDDKQSEFKQAWDKLPPSAAKLLPRADFHGFFMVHRGSPGNASLTFRKKYSVSR
ncbi:DUF3069 domain-containing protein [Shewanella algae]|uniref:DUF3069 domain-containing protein n=1 Tax=Shewanella algae TaxID=38313 RepID=UPI003CFD0884